MPYEIKITVTESAIATEADAHARHNEIFLLIEDTLVEAGLMTDNTVIGGWPIVWYEEEDEWEREDRAKTKALDEALKNWDGE